MKQEAIRTALRDWEPRLRLASTVARDYAAQVLNAVLKLFVWLFPRPNLPNEDLNRSATVIADFFAISIVYTLADFITSFTHFTPLGKLNYVLYTSVLILIRHHAVKGRLKFAVAIYAASVIYFYLVVTASVQYFEHLQASNLLLVVAFSTITMGPGTGFVTLSVSLALFYFLRLESDAGALVPLISRLPTSSSSYRQEWLMISTNLVEMYIFCCLVRSHIFSQLNISIAKERGIAAKEEVARKAADKAEGEKTRFIASASHDLRQPVSSLVLNFEAHFSAHPELASDPAVNDMRSSIDSLSNMLESILTISKLDANVLVPNVVMASVNDILERCYAANAASARQKNLDFRMIETDLFCETDPDMLFRAINNIVNNAVKYTKSGGILIGVRRRFGGHAIFVMDSGIGIPSDSLNSIYDEFTMLLDSSRKAGSGLGLSIVKKILRLLGMEIHTLSSVGVGSTFYIELPKTYAIPTARKNAQQLKRSAEDSSPPLAVTLEPKRMELKGPLVAVVDDVETLRSTICRVLQVHGIRTIDVSEWSELERLIEVEPPDLLITDYKLEHGVTGYDIILAARKKVSDKLPCFIITGDTSPALVSEMSARGVDIYYKPVKMGTLMDAVNTQLMKAC